MTALHQLPRSDLAAVRRLVNGSAQQACWIDAWGCWIGWRWRSDPRDPERITHGLSSIVMQRVFALCLGHEHLSDHGGLRGDLLLQTTVEPHRACPRAPADHRRRRSQYPATGCGRESVQAQGSQRRQSNACITRPHTRFPRREPAPVCRESPAPLRRQMTATDSPCVRRSLSRAWTNT